MSEHFNGLTPAEAVRLLLDRQAKAGIIPPPRVLDDGEPLYRRRDIYAAMELIKLVQEGGITHE